MGKESLEYIRGRLNRAKHYLEDAEGAAREVGDSSGASKVSKVIEKVKEVEKEFSKDR